MFVLCLCIVRLSFFLQLIMFHHYGLKGSLDQSTHQPMRNVLGMTRQPACDATRQRSGVLLPEGSRYAAQSTARRKKHFTSPLKPMELMLNTAAASTARTECSLPWPWLRCGRWQWEVQEPWA